MKVEDRLRMKKKKMSWNDTENKCIEHAWDMREEISKLSSEEIIPTVVNYLFDTPGIDLRKYCCKLERQPEGWLKIILEAREEYGNQ